MSKKTARLGLNNTPARRNPMSFPRWACIPALAGMISCGDGSAPRSPGASTDGAVVYQVCMGCHGHDGQGVTGGLAPSLIGSEILLADDTGPLIKLLLHGVENDGTWPGLMMPWRDVLSDQQIAAVLTHIRNQWGNAAPVVSAEDVAETRSSTADRTAPYPREELRD